MALCLNLEGAIMAITREIIETKFEELNKNREQAIATINAIAGARQILESLLEELDKQDKDEKK